MTATHTPTRRTRKPRRRTVRIPRLGWWWAAIALGLFAVAKTWPLYTVLVVALAAIGCVTAARRPAWLQRAATRLPATGLTRRHLPAPGQRTLDSFQRMTPERFEHAIAELACEDPRIHTATRVGQANDRGADVIAHTHDGRRILIQCKRYRHGNNVGSETVQTINGVYRDIHHCHAAVIVTTARFTRAALETNARLPYGIGLIDGEALTRWANGGHAPW